MGATRLLEWHPNRLQVNSYQLSADQAPSAEDHLQTIGESFAESWSNAMDSLQEMPESEQELVIPGFTPNASTAVRRKSRRHRRVKPPRCPAPVRGKTGKVTITNTGERSNPPRPDGRKTVGLERLERLRAEKAQRKADKAKAKSAALALAQQQYAALQAAKLARMSEKSKKDE